MCIHLKELSGVCRANVGPQTFLWGEVLEQRSVRVVHIADILVTGGASARADRDHLRFDAKIRPRPLKPGPGGRRQDWR